MNFRCEVLVDKRPLNFSNYSSNKKYALRSSYPSRCLIDCIVAATDFRLNGRLYYKNSMRLTISSDKYTACISVSQLTQAPM